MTLKRLISIICLITILIDIQPVGASENYNKINNSIEQEELDSQDDNESEESLQDDNENAESLQSDELVTNEPQNDSLQDDNENEESLQSDESVTNESQNNPLQDIIFKFSIEKISNPYLQIGFDNLSLTYTSKIYKDILNSIKDSTIISDMNKEIINLVIFDVLGNEKLNLMISMDYLLNNDSLSELESIEYKNGDKIFIKVLQEEICSVSIDGILQQDITLEQENYSDGIENLDYLNNVYFAVESTGVTAIYNEAPIIEGIIDSEVSNFNDFDPLEGVTVLDDHDENLIELLRVEGKDLNEKQKQFTYSVADKFGRLTEATRIITLKEISENSLVNTETTLQNNTIAVKGIKFGSNSQYGDSETRFNITFNDKSRKIYVTNQDGRSMNSRVNGTYFKMVLYDPDGNIKKELQLNGSDRSSSSKLDELRYHGWAYKYGDYISIWHYDAPIKISISGVVNQAEDQDVIDFSSGLTRDILENTRFKLTSTGLLHTINNPPTISFLEGDEGVVIYRGEEPNLLHNVSLDDDFGFLDFKITSFDFTEIGEHFVTYEAIDNWGVSTTATRKFTVMPKNKIEETFIRVKSIDGNNMFSIGFDEINRKFVINAEDIDDAINPSNKSVELTIRVFNEHNFKKREFKIMGKDTVNSSNVKKLTNYKYDEGDYLQIIPNTPSLLSIDGEIEGVPNGIDYNQGVTDLDKWTNVRFKLSKGIVSYNYNEAPNINGNDDIQVIRGESFNILDGMKVNDDKDGEVQLTGDNSIVKLKSGGEAFIGEQVYEIKYTDSWGRTSSVDRKVIINPKNIVEKYNIEIFDENQTILSFAYDSINKKFKVLSYNPEYSFVNSEENAFVLEFYDYENHQKQQEVILKSEDLIDNNFLEKLTGFTIEDDWYMKLWYHDYSKIRITTKDSSIADITFDDNEKMNNTRFNISNSGIDSIYNEAPKILGVDDISIVYGTVFDEMQDVIVDDEEEGLVVSVSADINTNELGDNILTYEVTDSFGRTTVETRKITVVPLYTVNKVKYYNDNNEEMFSIGINKSATGFTVDLPEVIPSEAHSSRFNFKVFNANGENIYELNINSDTIIDEELFNQLKGLIIRPDYLFSIGSEDLTKIKIFGTLNKDQQVETIDYENLNNNDIDRNAIDNVRFKLTENIVEVIYNEAPQINIDQGYESLTRNQAIKQEDYDLLEGLSISDDKDEDKLTLNDIDVILPQDVDILTDDIALAEQLIGQTVTIKYKVEDSWGRTSNEISRQLTIQSAMDEVEIELLYADTGLIADKSKVSANIEFDMANGRINLINGNYDSFKFNQVQYGAFAIVAKDGTIKSSSILGTQNSYDNDDPIFSQPNQTTNVVNRFKELIESKTIEYGDKLVLRIYQAPFMYINGKVIDNQEDYSEGVKIGGILSRSQFEITPAGLKQIYEGPIINSSNFSQLTIYNIIGGIQSVNMYLDNSNPDDLVLKAESLDSEWLDTLNYGKLFKVEIIGSDGRIINSGDHDGRTRPNNFANKYNGTRVDDGSYLTIHWYDSEKINNSKLYNITRLDNFTEEVDYSGNIPDPTYFDDVRFYFTREGIVPTYNSAPKFSGIEDISISLGQEFNDRDGVYLNDDHDGSTLNYQVSGTVNNAIPGEYILTYSATDNWGREGSYERKVYVKPEIHENNFEIYTKDNEKSFSINFEPELIENSTNGKLTITAFSEEALDIDRPTDEIFKVFIYREDKSLKEKVVLLGRDTGNSAKLNVLNELEYEDGDYIKVWRAPEINASNAAINGVKIIGDIDGDNINFEDPSKGIDYMNNTIFYIKPSGLEAYYNLAPVLDGVRDLIIYFGDTSYDLLDGVVGTSDREEGELTVRVTPETIETNRLGTTQVTYYVTDSWGRTTSETATVTVRSKSYLNYFEIGRNHQTKSYIGFNSDINKFQFYNSSGEVSIDELDVSNIPNDLNISLYSRFGNKKLSIELLPTDTLEEKKEKLNELELVDVEVFDMIQISTSEYSNIKVKGDIVNSIGNYENGFTSEEEMTNVRFQITNQGLKETFKATNDEVIFKGLEKLTIKRGENSDLLNGVTVSHPNEIIRNITVSDFDNMTVGTYTVTYSVEDSWGSIFTKERIVEVLPFNELEEVRIRVSDIDSTELIRLKFDYINSTLSYELNNTSSSLISKLKEILLVNSKLSKETNILTVSTFNNNMEKIESIAITKNDIINETPQLNEIYNIPFVEGGFIGIDIYDFNNSDALDIAGPVTYEDNSKNYYQDMRHVRYKITQNGIEGWYNEAPEVTSKDVEHKLSDDFDLMNAINIDDDRDKLDSIKVDFSDYDLYEVGNYDVTATVTDSWDLETKVSFKVQVLSYLDENNFILKSHTGEEIVSIGFNSRTGKLLVHYYEENDGIELLPSSSEETIMNFKIYNENQTELATIPFNKNDTVSTIKHKLERYGFIDYSYHYNYFTGIEVIDDNAKSLVKITNVIKGSKELEDVDYENAITNIDYLENVRFELNHHGLIAIYNRAPIINISTDYIQEVKSLNVEDYDLLRDIELSDDRDQLNIKDIDIKYNGSDDSSQLVVGDNNITLTIKDTWGRESQPVNLNLNLISAMDNVDITFLYADDGLIPDLNNKSAKLTFNMDEGKILVENLANNNSFKVNYIQYGAFGVYDKNDTLIFKAILGQNNSFDGGDPEFTDARRYTNVSNFKTDLENVDIDYGYKIKIKIYQSPFVYINGNIINPQEDYSEGAYLAEILHNSTFEITEEGLVQEYNKPEDTPKNNDIVWLSGVAGVKLFNININPETRRLVVTKMNGDEPLDTLYKENSELFSIHVYDSEGNHSYGIDATTRQGANAIINALNNREFEIGGYLTIKIHPTNRNRMKNMKIYGNIIKTESDIDVDFSEEIKDVSHFNESRFYFTENGLALSYNDKPQFTGLTDVVLLNDGTESVNLIQGVEVSDDNTPDIEYEIQDSDGNLINNVENYVPSTLGAHEIYYVARDNLGRESREPRFIWLQAASDINLKDENLLTIQEARPDLQTEDAIMQYLINLVTVHDVEDDLNGMPIKITEDNITGTFNPNLPGEYPITYRVQDSDGNISEETFNITVIRTINVSVPTYIPFQIVTNLISDPNNMDVAPEPFLAGVMKIKNNYLTNVDVYLKEFSKVSGTGGLEIVSPNRFSKWDELTEEETMKYMALGIYNKSNFENSTYSKDSPLWLGNNSNEEYIGTLPKATSLDSPNSAELSFVSKHGTKFIGGTSKAKFNLILEFR